MNIPADDVAQVATYAREWVADCGWSDEIETLLAAMSDDAIIRHAGGHYDGGIPALYRDAMASAAAPDVSLARYVVVLKDDGAPLESTFVLFFDAEDAEHAREQAEDAEPSSVVLTVGTVPVTHAPAMVGEPAAAAAEHEAMQAAVSEADVVRDTYADDPFVTNEDFGAMVETAAAADDARALESERPDDDNHPVYGSLGSPWRPRARGKRHMAFFTVGSDTAERVIVAPDVSAAVALALATAPDGFTLVAVYASGDGFNVLRRYLRDA